MIIHTGQPVRGICVFCIAILTLVLGPLNPASAAEPTPAATEPARYVLAVSWQPGFCETRPAREECRTQTAGRVDARQFSLHGLWPLHKNYCGVPDDLKARYRKAQWMELPPVELSPEMTARLHEAMPGTVSGLDRQQWQRSGTCSGLTAEHYFGLSLAMLDRLNASPVQALFAGRIGSAVSQNEVGRAFDEAFGAGERVRLRCRKDGERQVITGLTIGLSGLPQAGESDGAMGPLILAGGKTAVQCATGIVDAAGLQ